MTQLQCRLCQRSVDYSSVHFTASTGIIDCSKELISINKSLLVLIVFASLTFDGVTCTMHSILYCSLSASWRYLSIRGTSGQTVQVLSSVTSHRQDSDFPLIAVFYIQDDNDVCTVGLGLVHLMVQSTRGMWNNIYLLLGGNFWLRKSGNITSWHAALHTTFSLPPGCVARVFN